MTSKNGSKAADTRRLAILIDADNAQPSAIGGLLDEVAKYGTASVRRIYGDFTSTQQSGWKKVLLQHSIQPMQQFAYTSGKNATDSTLIIDAMDLMYTGRFDGFCLVSSDSDFTRLAQRLREEGLTVYGFGERKTPDAFVQACDKFVYTEVLRAEPVPAAVAKKPTGKGLSRKVMPVHQVQGANESAAGAARASGPTAVPVDLIRQAIDQASDESGWANLGAVGNYLNKVRPDFDPRLYGKKKLSDLLKMHPLAFRLEERAAADGQGKIVFVAVAG
ncbi:NYN domain-containing protein [Cognatilysobacter lacus]|uniref:NYN domain-containing protein n=1 Tax=Cognatilysobacter lacus TaxID=1643323 RepID=A0A5D8Z7L6_9GAMM|nr:NYN domain-containing protein [Lysobacter lacus]TZF90680.1 NYN domain-containing protein [Lysobacter lacus]